MGTKGYGGGGSTLKKAQIEKALKRLGELLKSNRVKVELVAAGGVISVLQFGNREATHDVDAIFPPEHKDLLKRLILQVAEEQKLPGGESPWMNDSVSFFGLRTRTKNAIFSHSNLVLCSASWPELLGMKLSGAWRGPEDISDAVEILRKIGSAERAATLKDVLRYKNFTPNVTDKVVTARFEGVWEDAFDVDKKGK